MMEHSLLPSLSNPLLALPLPCVCAHREGSDGCIPVAKDRMVSSHHAHVLSQWVCLDTVSPGLHIDRA